MAALTSTMVRQGILALALSAGSACNTELQAQADVFMEAVDKGDYPKLQSVASESLLAELTESKFADFVATYDELGDLEDKTRSGVGIQNGTRSVTYQLDFVNGDVQLVVVSNDDKLDGFELTGSGWKSAQINRQRHGLEKLLAAARASDRGALRALVHPSISDEQLEGLLAQVAQLGTHTMVHVHDDAIPEFRVEFPETKMIASVRMSGPTITGYSFRPS